MSNLFWLTEAQTARLLPFFCKCHGRPRVDDIFGLEALLSSSSAVACGGATPWDYGPAKTLHNRRKRWSDDEVIGRIMVGLSAEDADPMTTMIDVD